MMQQFGLEQGFQTQAAAQRATRGLVSHLRRVLRAKGWQDFQPPPMPSPKLDLEVSGIDRGCRVLVAWIPEWLPTQFAGQFAVRVDTTCIAVKRRRR